MAAPQRGQCQRLELSEGIWQVPASAGPGELELSSCWHNSKLETRKRFRGGKSHLAWFAAMGVILPVEGAALVLESQQAKAGLA